MIVKDLLLDVDFEKLLHCYSRERMFETDEEIMAHMSDFLEEVASIQPDESDLLLLVACDSLIFLSLFRKGLLTKEFNPQCPLLEIGGIRDKSLMELKALCKKEHMLQTYTIRRMPWSLILGAEVDPTNLADWNSATIAAMIVDKMTKDGYTEEDASSEWETDIEGAAESKYEDTDEVEFYVSWTPISEEELLLFRRRFYESLLGEEIEKHLAVQRYFATQKQVVKEVYQS